MQRITFPAACVLHALSKGEAYGLDIMERTGLPSGTVYPMLRRFEHAGLVSSGWETPEEALAGRRPQRRNYALTVVGWNALERARERYHKQLAVFDLTNPETGVSG
jgi:DNA-binding PadR family transcriptional regulator